MYSTYAAYSTSPRDEPHTLGDNMGAVYPHEFSEEE